MMINDIKNSTLTKIIEIFRNFQLEQKLYFTSLLIGIVISFIGSIINLILNSSIISVEIPVMLTIILGFVLYLSYKYKIFEPFINIVISIGFIGVSIIWVFNGGSSSSNNLVSLLILSASLLMVKPKNRIYIFSFYLVNIFILYYIDFFQPSWIVPFESKFQQWLDSFITLFYVSVSMYILIVLLHKHYEDEKKKVETQGILLQKANFELLKANKTKDKMFSIIAHDLKNPINNFQKVTSVLLEDFSVMEDKDKIEFISLLEESAVKIEAMLENILVWANNQVADISFNILLHSLEDLINENISLNNLHIRNKNISVITDITFHEKSYFDYDLISTVIRNLITNAIKFTNFGGLIIVNCSIYNKDENYLLVSIQDNGIGIAEEKLLKIFERDNQKVSIGTSNECGTGLGLILCKEFVELHGGKIWVESQVNYGSTFSFILPKIAMNIKRK